MNPFLKDYEKACDMLANEFAHKYFSKGVEIWWIADEVGGVLCVGDYFFNIRDIADFIRYKYTRKMLFKYYDYVFKEHQAKRIPINIKNFKSNLAKR